MHAFAAAKCAVFALMLLPMAVVNLREIRIRNADVAALLAAGLGMLAIGQGGGLFTAQVPPPGPAALAVAFPLGLFLLRMIPGGVAKYLIALLPWFGTGEYAAMIAAGFLLSAGLSAALRRKQVGIVLPVGVPGFLMLLVHALPPPHG